MKKILTFGVYDMLHIGHMLLFKRAKELGDYLIVAVQDGECILKYKPGTVIGMLRHIGTSETVAVLRGVADEVFFMKRRMR